MQLDVAGVEISHSGDDAHSKKLPDVKSLNQQQSHYLLYNVNSWFKHFMMAI